jgi:hypothetical protein
MRQRERDETMSTAVFYNLAPPSPGRQAREVNRELAALAREFRPRVLGACEAIGYGGLLVPGYQQVRDVSRAGRANLVAFVRDDCNHRRHWWMDLHQTWTRTERRGTHPARSVLVLAVGTVQVLVHHAPPKHTDNTLAAQQEAVRRIGNVMAPWRHPDHAARWADPAVAKLASMGRPRLCLADWNRLRSERGPGATYVASVIGGKVHGATRRPGDGAVSRSLPATGAEYVTHASGVELGTDHPSGAFVLHMGTDESVTW